MDSLSVYTYEYEITHCFKNKLQREGYQTNQKFSYNILF